MLRKRLNLGIVAHVDAGKTTLTERLLYIAGLIDEVGSVDKGTTQTDTLPLEQQRGITIRSAVVSFPIDDVTVNLIDTPGHPDFIAEVERVLSVLDGAVLVVSVVEGVQPQTRVLMRALGRLRIPTVLFVNKMDRVGADPARVLDEIGTRLTPTALPIGAPDDVAFAQQYAAQSGPVHPVYFGSAKTGAGVEKLRSGLVELLPSTAGDADGRLSGSVFKIERGAAGERIAYVRLFSGTLRVRDHIGEAKVTELGVFEHGATPVQRASAAAGEIAQVRGLADVQVGDVIGEGAPRGVQGEFGPPTLESVVAPLHPADAEALRAALAQLAEQDPLINVQQDDERQELSVSLYGEVQMEVLEAMLAAEYGIAVVFRETTPLYIERVLRRGEAVEPLNAASNPYNAAVGLRIDAAPEGAGVDVRLAIDTRTIPLYVYKSPENFAESMDDYVRASLRRGLRGWQVTDCVVTMTECGYPASDGPPSRRGPRSTAADFRKLTPLVLEQALERAGTVVCEPIARITLELPVEKIGAVVAALGRLGAAIEPPLPDGERSIVDAVLPAVRADELQRELPRLTGGEGVLDSTFAGYRPVSGKPPVRARRE